MLWSVYIQYQPPAARRINEIPERLDVLADEMAAYDGVVAGNEHGWSAQFDLGHEGGPAEVLAEGLRVCTKAASAAGLGDWLAVRCEVMTVAAQETDLDRPQIPALVGAHEVGELLGVSRQRVHQLRSDGRLPEPLFHLAATPVWSAAGIKAFAHGRDRTPGRRPADLRVHFDGSGGGRVMPAVTLLAAGPDNEEEF